MNRVIDYFKQYIGVISIVLAVCILLTYTFSHFVVTSDNHRSAEMYIGELKYSITIDGTNTNTLTVPSGETIVEMKINSLNSVDTYYKLLYQKDSNIEIKYYDKTLDTDEVATNYDSVNDKILANKTNNIKLAIQNNSSSDITITFKVSGGYITNTLADVVVPTNYSETNNLVTEKQYFCTTSDTLETGLIYVNGVYTYRYKRSARGMFGLQFDLHWYDEVLSEDGWGVQYNNKESTDPVTDKVCTFINNKPIISMANMFFSTYSTSIDFSSFNTKRVITMESMFQSIADYTKSPTLDAALSKLKELDLSNFDTSNVTDMSEMFSYNESLTTIYVSDKFVTDKVTNSSGMFSLCDELVGGNGTTYNSSNVDKTYARIDEGTNNPGYFTNAYKFTIPDISLTSDSEGTLSITNNGIHSIQIKSIRDTSNILEIIGTTKPIIDAGQTNTDFKVKSSTAGKYDIIIEIIDINNNVYNISLKLTVAQGYEW